MAWGKEGAVSWGHSSRQQQLLLLLLLLQRALLHGAARLSKREDSLCSSTQSPVLQAVSMSACARGPCPWPSEMSLMRER